MKTIPALLFILFFSNTYAQQTEINPDSVIIKLTVSTADDKKLETIVSFEDLLTHKIKKCKTDKEGKGSCTVSTAANYRITIKESNDYYDYSIPDFAISPVLLNFKFNLTGSNNILSAGIRVFNKKDLKDIYLRSPNTAPVPHKITDNTVYLELDSPGDYEITVPGVEIKNSFIKSRPEDESLSFILNFSDDKHAELILVKNTETAINITYQDLYDGKLVPDEPVFIKAASGSSEYRIKTGSNGTAMAVVPANASYNISLKYFDNVLELNTNPGTNAITTNTVLLKFPSSKDFEFEKQERARRLRERDSLYAIWEKEREKEKERLKVSDSLDYVKRATLGREEKKELEKDENYFKKNNIDVCEVLKRNSKRWVSKMIVTDVTGSMSPYTEQVIMWHMLELMNKERSDYIFFNDGDRTPDNLKVIGNTGGIYLNLKGGPDSVLKTLNTASRNGSGGDGPENDIEALLEAVKHMKGGAELILIADHLSPVKDIELLKKLRIPVRVILCGALDGYSHPDYLEIAYQTGGSIHTIEEDIFDLARLHDDETITVGGTIYKFMRGRFFSLSKKI